MRHLWILRLLGVSAIRSAGGHAPVPIYDALGLDDRRRIRWHNTRSADARYVLCPSDLVSVLVFSSTRPTLLCRLRNADRFNSFVCNGLLGPFQQRQPQYAACGEGIPAGRWTRLVGQVLAARGKMGWHCVSVRIRALGTVLLRSQCFCMFSVVRHPSGV